MLLSVCGCVQMILLPVKNQWTGRKLLISILSLTVRFANSKQISGISLTNSLGHVNQAAWG